MFMPLGLITALAFVQFSTEIGEKSWFVRVDHSVTLLLTAAAYTSAVSSSLPEIGYATLLDKYLLSCLLLLALFVVENPIVRTFVIDDGNMDTISNGIDPVMLDRTFSVILGGVWLALHIVTACRAWTAQSHARQMLSEEGLKKASKKLQVRRETLARRGSLMWMPRAVLDGEQGLRAARREGERAVGDSSIGNVPSISQLAAAARITSRAPISRLLTRRHTREKNGTPESEQQTPDMDRSQHSISNDTASCSA